MEPEADPFGVVVLYNASDKLIKGEPRDVLAEQGVIACAHAVAEAFQCKGYQVALMPLYGDVEIAMASYPSTDWVVFNLGEGLDGRLFEEARIAWALEAMGYQFTGSRGDAISRSLHKAEAKALLTINGVETPPWWFLRHPDEVDALDVDEVIFPLIVKPVAEAASIGVGPDAVVHTMDGLRERVAYVVARYRQAALAEAFVVGREFNVALWGEPLEVLPLAEIDFSAFTDPFTRIVSFAAKWEENSFEYKHTPALCPAPTDSDLKVRIEDTARRAWAAIGCQGYARVDMRVSATHEVPYVVEVNCNPDLSPDAGFYRAARAAGYSYEDMLVRILEISRRQSSVYDRNGLRNRWPINLENNRGNTRFQLRGAELRPRVVERAFEPGRG